MQFMPVVWVDVEEYVKQRQQPVYMLKRSRVHEEPKAWTGQTQVGTIGTFAVPVSDFLSEDVQFSVTKTGDLVRIPMFAYKTLYSNPAAIFCLGIQLGLAVLSQLRRKIPNEPTEVHLVIGHQCTDLRPIEDAARCYVGVAFLMD